MSIQPPDPDAEGYCEPSDVVDFFDKYDQFNDSTDPTKDDVQERIRAASAHIDEETGHAWRERQVKGEMKDYRGQYYWNAGMPIFLMKRNIRTPLKSAQDLLDDDSNDITTQEEAEDKADRIKIWEGNNYEEWVASDSHEEGRGQEYWVDEAQGHLYIFRRRLWFRRHKQIEVTYRYGKETVPQDIRDACAYFVAAHYLESQQYRVTTPGNEEAPDPVSIAERWRELAYNKIKRHGEIRSQGMGTDF